MPIKLILVYFAYLKKNNPDIKGLPQLNLDSELILFIDHFANSVAEKMTNKNHPQDPGPERDPDVRAAWERIKIVTSK